MAEKTPPSYRWHALTHWANLAFLTAGGIAGATVDPSIWALMVPAQALWLWLVPDLPPFRAKIDAQQEATELQTERAYYLEQLWGLRPPLPRPFAERVRGLFVSDAVDDLDTRLQTRSAECAKYLEMRDIVSKLRDMVPLARTRITALDIVRLEHVINGYLRLVFACRPLGRAVSELDQAGLERELADVRSRLEEADTTLRPVLEERERLLRAQVTRAPKLRATLELMRARAEAIPYQLRNLHSQLISEPGTELQGTLDDMLERNDMLADPLADLASDAAVRDFLAEAPVVTPMKRRPAKQAVKR